MNTGILQVDAVQINVYARLAECIARMTYLRASQVEAIGKRAAGWRYSSRFGSKEERPAC
jgi:hypothetical protein